MNLPDGLIGNVSGWWWLLVLPLFWAVRRAPWAAVRDSNLRQHLLLAAIVAISICWLAEVGVKPGLHLHLLGATLLVLMFGPELALLILFAALLVVSFAGKAGWQALPINTALSVLLPVALAFGIQQRLRRLPANIFVFVFGHAFFCAAAVMLLTGMVIGLVLAVTGAYTWDDLVDQYLPYFILMAWAEAFLTGMATTVMVVYLPGWVAAFDDDRYLHGK